MELLTLLTERWNGLQAREQAILRLGAVILGALFFYLLVIGPVYSGRDAAEESLRATREAFSVAQQQAADLKASPSNSAISGSGSFLAQVESSAQREGLRNALKRMQPSGDDQVQVSLEGASYQQVMQWLGKLHQQGVNAQRVTMQVDRKSDYLIVQLLLQR